MTEHVSADELRGRTRGSRADHETLAEATRVKLALSGLEAFPIYTGGIPRFLRGQMLLTRNPHQIGIADMLCPFLDLFHVGERRLLRIDEAAHGDLLVIGRTALLEFKTGSARRSPAQVRVTKLWETRAGALCLLVRSTEDVDSLIAAHQKAERYRCRT